MSSSPLPVCRCEKETRVITSWTSKNPGRRFAVCAEGCCGYWAWIDEEMCRRATEIIPGLLRKINATEKDRDEYEEIARRNERKLYDVSANLVIKSVFVLVLMKYLLISFY
nr:uncharacterized protein LOC113687547 [Coffea arabica]